MYRNLHTGDIGILAMWASYRYINLLTGDICIVTYHIGIVPFFTGDMGFDILLMV